MKKPSLLFLVSILLFSCNNEIIDLQAEPPCDNGAFVGVVMLATQQEVEDFGAMCYSSITGNLIIGNILQNDMREDTNISSLTPLTNLKLISNGLQIESNPLLSNLEGLENLEMIGGVGLSLINNDALTSLDNLMGLSFDTNTQRLSIIGNDSLTNLKGLEGIVSVEDRIFVASNDSLISLEGLNGVQSVQILTVANNEALESLTGLEGITTLNELTIERNERLSSLEGFNNQISLTILFIRGNSINSLEPLSEILNNEMESIEVWYEQGLMTLNGLENISSIEYLDLYCNNNLNSLQGLLNVVELEYLEITCSNLETLNGLDRLNSSDTIRIGLWTSGNSNGAGNNLLINYCSLQNLFINGVYGEVMLENNAYNPSVQDIIDGNCSQ